jgi:hypothetical protein
MSTDAEDDEHNRQKTCTEVQSVWIRNCISSIHYQPKTPSIATLHVCDNMNTIWWLKQNNTLRGILNLHRIFATGTTRFLHLTLTCHLRGKRTHQTCLTLKGVFLIDTVTLNAKVASFVHIALISCQNEIVPWTNKFTLNTNGLIITFWRFKLAMTRYDT